MGLGDELMAMGEAEAIWRATGSRVAIVDAAGQPRWSEVWALHPAIAAVPNSSDRVRLVNAPGARPYIERWETADGKPQAVFNEWRARDHLGRLHLSESEWDLGRELTEKIGPYVVLETGIKDGSSPNKDWGRERFAEVVRILPDATFVQLGAAPEPVDGARGVRTASFREACGVLAHAAAYIGPEGGLHHAAAALRVPAVVVFGAFIAPETTGYPFHRNFYIDDGHGPCGRWASCAECRKALDRIQPDDVAAALRCMLSRRAKEVS